MSKLVQVLKVVALFLLWMLFSPLFFYFDKKWSFLSKSKRYLLLLFSPFVLIALWFLTSSTIRVYPKFARAGRHEIEQRSGVRFPNYSMKNRADYIISVFKSDSKQEDYRLDYEVQISRDEMVEFFDRLDELIQNGFSNNDFNVVTRQWSRNAEGDYNFIYLQNSPREFLNITIGGTSGNAQIQYGQ